MRQRISYANVMSTVAVFAALGGGAYAATKVGSDDIARNAVKSKHVDRNALKGGDIKESTLKGTPPLAYAHVVNGSAVPSRSRGVTIVPDSVFGTYCMNVRGNPKNVQATVDENSPTVAMANLDPAFCPTGAEVEVLTAHVDQTFEDADFFVVFH